MKETDATVSADVVRSGFAGASSEQFAAIGKIIASVRPAIQADGGDLELVSLDDDIVRVRLSGACTHCSLAAQTLGGIRRQIIAALGIYLRVLPAPSE